MSRFFQMLVFMLMLLLSLKITLLEQRVSDTYDKIEDMAIIAALSYNAEPDLIEKLTYKRYEAPPIEEEFPWMLEEPLPKFIPPPKTF